MKKSVLLWLIAFVLTVITAVYQRLTGPTYPISGEAKIGSEVINYKLDRTHGGEGDHHGENRPADSTIPWVITGPCVKEGFELPSEPRLRVFDTAATILWAWGLELPGDLDGKPITNAFFDRAFTP